MCRFRMIMFHSMLFSGACLWFPMCDQQSPPLSARDAATALLRYIPAPLQWAQENCLMHNETRQTADDRLKEVFWCLGFKQSGHEKTDVAPCSPFNRVPRARLPGAVPAPPVARHMPRYSKIVTGRPSVPGIPAVLFSSLVC
jgi:hypothetical protein